MVLYLNSVCRLIGKMSLDDELILKIGELLLELGFGKMVVHDCHHACSAPGASSQFAAYLFDLDGNLKFCHNAVCFKKLRYLCGVVINLTASKDSNIIANFQEK